MNTLVKGCRVRKPYQRNVVQDLGFRSLVTLVPGDVLRSDVKVLHPRKTGCAIPQAISPRCFCHLVLAEPYLGDFVSNHTMRSSQDISVVDEGASTDPAGLCLGSPTDTRVVRPQQGGEGELPKSSIFPSDYLLDALPRSPALSKGRKLRAVFG